MKKSHTLLFFFCVVAAGCGYSKESQLQQVARDWNLTIRASQIIPVYPLTEDLMPGDVYLVKASMDQQKKLYKKGSFLPLDLHLARLIPKNASYRAFYQTSFWAGGNDKTVPKYWMDTRWTSAPLAYFPTYSFSVDRKGGMNLAFPVEGVPVGLSLLGADSANGSIDIKDAHTYGLDAESLYMAVRGWENNSTNTLLQLYASEGDLPWYKDITKRVRRNYIRVVTRVFLANELNVYIKSKGSAAGGVSAGFHTPVNLLFAENGDGRSTDSLKAYKQNLDTMNKTLNTLLDAGKSAKEFLPGGTLQVTAASSRDISLKQRFARPVALGYLGFDMLIGTDGALGPPIPTISLFTSGENLAPAENSELRLFQRSALASIYRSLDEKAKGLSGSRAKQAKKIAGRLDKMANSLLPFTYPCSFWKDSGSSPPSLQIKARKGGSVTDETMSEFFLHLMRYWGQAQESVRVIQKAMNDQNIKVEMGNAPRRQFLEIEMENSRGVLRELEMKLKQNSVLLHEAVSEFLK